MKPKGSRHGRVCGPGGTTPCARELFVIHAELGPRRGASLLGLCLLTACAGAQQRAGGVASATPAPRDASAPETSDATASSTADAVADEAPAPDACPADEVRARPGVDSIECRLAYHVPGSEEVTGPERAPRGASGTRPYARVVAVGPNEHATIATRDLELYVYFEASPTEGRAFGLLVRTGERILLSTRYEFSDQPANLFYRGTGANFTGAIQLPQPDDRPPYNLSCRAVRE